MNDLPENGWSLLDVEDLWEPLHQCEYCHVERIRYVHTIAHVNAGQIRVGRICAEKLTGDGATPARREADLQKQAAAYARWSKGRAWTISDLEHVRIDGPPHWRTSVTFYFKAGKWWWLETPPGGGEPLPCVLPRDSVEAAKRDYWAREIARRS